MSFLWHGLTEEGAQVPVQVDAQGRVVAVDGTPGTNYWARTGTTLSPVNAGDSVDIGSGNINLNADGTASALQFFGDRPSASNFVYGTALNGTRTSSWLADSTLNIGTNSVGGNPKISLNADGSAEFKGSAMFAGGKISFASNGSGTFYRSGTLATQNVFVVSSDANGAATSCFEVRATGDVIATGNITASNVTFRSADPQFYVKKSKHIDAQPEYVGPELDLLAEIARLEALVRHLYETLRLAPPAGWPVWDGNDDVLRQLRK